ncbi:MAG: hypothetical protein V3T31_07595, partial [candidate division Zixibacteria bacterium]
TSSGFMDIVLCNSAYDTKVYVYENSYTPGSPLACNDDTPGCGPSGYRSTLLGVPVTSGNDYFIVVDGYDAASSGAYTLEISAGAEPTGGCCLPDNTCVDVTEADCLAAGGDYLGDATACLGDNNSNGQDDACEDPCPLGTMFSQPVMPPEGVWSAGVSDHAHADALNRFERFTGVTGDIIGIQVWGIRAYHDGSSWSECSESPMGLDFSFYTDVAGAPSTWLYGTTVHVTPVATTMLYSGFTLYEFTAYFTTPISVPTDRWVNVQGGPVGGDDPNCWFLWMNASSGLDGTHILETNGTPASAEYDLSLCILGEPPTPTGACCFTDGSCLEVEEADCIAAGGTYDGDWTTCATVTCVATGACCTPADCYELTESDCGFVPGGNYKGNGTSCATETCVDEVGRCCTATDCQDILESLCDAIPGSEFHTGGACSDPFPCGMGTCCGDNASGNINCDRFENVDISDLTTLVNYLFVTQEPLCCPNEANVTGDTQGDIDISDLTKLVNHLFVTFELLAECSFP